jgi:hypothetical protein
MFTRRFIKLPIKVYDLEHKEITGQELCKDTYTMVNPFTISRYRPSDENNGVCTHITFKDGDCILTYISVREFEKLANEHSDITNSIP